MYEEILLYHFPDFAKEYLEKVEDGICPYDHIFKNENRLKVILNFYQWSGALWYIVDNKYWNAQ